MCVHVYGHTKNITICMYGRIHICLPASMHVCVHLFRAHTFNVYIHAWTHNEMLTSKYFQICAGVRVHACPYVSIRVCYT